MKMMGLTSGLHWLAWFLKYLIFLLIAVILLTVFIKVDAGKGAIMNASEGSVIFVFCCCILSPPSCSALQFPRASPNVCVNIVFQLLK